MKRFFFAACIVTAFWLSHVVAEDEGKIVNDNHLSRDYFVKQGELMECEPPKFFLIEDIDFDEREIVGMSSMLSKGSIIAFHLSFNFDKVKLTNARRVPIDETQLNQLKGKLVVMTEGKKPLGAAYLGLFCEDTVVMTILPESAKQ